MYLKKQVDKRLKDIVFIELNKDVELKEIELKKEINLPVRLDGLIEGIKDKSIDEKIDLSRINEGIIYLLGIEKDFRFKDEYLKIIKFAVKDIKALIIYLSSQAANLDDNIASFIYLNSYDNFIEYDLDLEFAKANIKEVIYNKEYKNLSEEEQKEFLEDIANDYEDILNHSEEYILSYYRLGYIYRNLNYYLKSKLYFEKFLNNSENEYEELKDEIREDLKELDDYANLEASESYIAYGKLDKAYESLNNVSDLYPEKEKLHYYKALTSFGLGLLEESLDHINQSLNYNDEVEEYYNLKAQIYLNLEDLERTKETYKVGIDKLPESYLLNYNFGIFLYNIKDQAFKPYLEKAYELNPNDQIKSLLI